MNEAKETVGERRRDCLLIDDTDGFHRAREDSQTGCRYHTHISASRLRRREEEDEEEERRQ